MANVRVQWTNPVPTPTQRPLDHIRFEARVVATPTLPWTAIPLPSPLDEQLLIQDVAAGAWEFQVTVVDDNPDPTQAESAPANVMVSVPFDGPGSVTNLTATIE